MKQRNKLGSSFFFNGSIITDAQLRSLRREVGKQKALQTIHCRFSYCETLSEKGLTCLMESLKFLRSLRNISLYFTQCMQITDITLANLSRNLSNLYFLENFCLNFYQCKIMDKGLGYLGRGLEQLRSVKSIYISLSW